MHISYKPLWHTLVERNMRKEDLRIAAGLTTNMIANMGKGKNISMETLVRICETLNCGILDVIELEQDDKLEFGGGKSMDSLIKFLKDKITDKTPLEEIVDVFEQMCSIPLEEDMILFETGTFTTFASEPVFEISLVRQFPNDDEEFFQIHVDILYKPTSENKMFSEATWNEDLSENIFDYIRKSEVFAYAKNKEYIKVEIYLDET